MWSYALKYMENSLEASLPGPTTSGCQHCDAFGVTQAAFAACGRVGHGGFDREKLSAPRHHRHGCPRLLWEGVGQLQLLLGTTVALRQLGFAGM